MKKSFQRVFSMPESVAYYKCPVCLGVNLSKIKLEETTFFTLDVCCRCGGIWFDYGEIKLLQKIKIDTLPKHIDFKHDSFNMNCHSCHSFMNRNVDYCPKCNWKNLLDCPKCKKQMQKTKYSEFTIDYCTPCKGAWFDNIELSEIWNGKLKKHTQQFNSDKNSASHFLEIITYDPTILIDTPDILSTIGHLGIESSKNILSSAPDLAGDIVESSGELAGTVFEVIAVIIGDIFSG